MNSLVTDDTLARLSEGKISDTELHDVIRSTLGTDTPLARLRAHWPTQTLPIIDHYFCVSRLGQGTSGVVYKAIATRGALEVGNAC